MKPIGLYYGVVLTTRIDGTNVYNTHWPMHGVYTSEDEARGRFTKLVMERKAKTDAIAHIVVERIDTATVLSVAEASGRAG